MPLLSQPKDVHFSPKQPVLCPPHPTASCDLHQDVEPLCRGPTNTDSSDTRTPL